MRDFGRNDHEVRTWRSSIFWGRKFRFRFDFLKRKEKTEWNKECPDMFVLIQSNDRNVSSEKKNSCGHCRSQMNLEIQNMIPSTLGEQSTLNQQLGDPKIDNAANSLRTWTGKTPLSIERSEMLFFKWKWDGSVSYAKTFFSHAVNIQQWTIARK